MHARPCREPAHPNPFSARFPRRSLPGRHHVRIELHSDHLGHRLRRDLPVAFPVSTTRPFRSHPGRKRCRGQDRSRMPPRSATGTDIDRKSHRAFRMGPRSWTLRRAVCERQARPDVVPVRIRVPVENGPDAVPAADSPGTCSTAIRVSRMIGFPPPKTSGRIVMRDKSSVSVLFTSFGWEAPRITAAPRGAWRRAGVFQRRRTDRGRKERWRSAGSRRRTAPVPSRPRHAALGSGPGSERRSGAQPVGHGGGDRGSGIAADGDPPGPRAQGPGFREQRALRAVRRIHPNPTRSGVRPGGAEKVPRPFGHPQQAHDTLPASSTASGRTCLRGHWFETGILEAPMRTLGLPRHITRGAAWASSPARGSPRAIALEHPRCPSRTDSPPNRAK